MQLLWLFRKELAFALILAAAFGWHWNDKREAVNEAVAEVHAEYAAAAAEANAEARQLEQRRASMAQGLTDALTKSKERAERAARSTSSELDRLRLAIDEASASDTGCNAEPPADTDGDRARGLLGACAANLQILAGEADRLAAKVEGLQGFVGVCVSKPYMGTIMPNEGTR